MHTALERPAEVLTLLAPEPVEHWRRRQKSVNQMKTRRTTAVERDSEVFSAIVQNVRIFSSRSESKLQSNTKSVESVQHKH